MSSVNSRMLFLLSTVVYLFFYSPNVSPSEFPERECCDPVYPPPVPTAPTSSAATPTGRSGTNIKTAIAILNCLLARQLCFEDTSCSAILEIIPRVCGPELVACSTVTVTKCKAALRTLQAFPFFKPTCLCREPHVDPECNSFRDFLFDHPCVFVLKKEKDPYPVDALPTCNHALSVCQQERKCIKLFEDFKSNCKVRDNKCRMDDRELCHVSWTNLRLSPMFGCICPNNHMKRRCDRIFSIVNHNPCVGIISVKVMSTSENATSSFDYGLDMGIESQVENPLVDADNENVHTAILSDHIGITMLKNKMTHKPLLNISHYSEDIFKPHHFHRKIYSSNFDLHSENNELSKVIFQSTCHIALENCNNNNTCRVVLQPILHSCEISKCNRNSCMEALQNFYRKPDLTWSLEIAFCLCKKTENKPDVCMLAQEKLHPVCAQRIEGVPTPACHSLAESCREDAECRNRLEYYEQSCAVDSLTKKCAGSPSECRKAMLGILGTELRTTCACKGTDFTQLYDCLGWQRLLWINPCVVESQKDYHIRRDQLFMSQVPTTPITKMTTAELQATTSTFTVAHMTYMAYTEASFQTRENRNTEFIAIQMPSNISTTVTTTNMPKYCVFQRDQQSNQYIQEGKTKRMYHEDEVECSEICHCSVGEALVCHTICVERKPCKTEFALYNHAAPAYQAFRGRCLCYSGRFICMKPMPGEYSLPQGIFLFLGYSETDELLLKPHSNLTVHDAVVSLQEFLIQETDNGTLCTLSLYNVTKENIILAAKISEQKSGYDISPDTLLDHEREECISLLETISEKINTQHSDFNSHLLLSIFKLAEVEIIESEASSALAIHIKLNVNLQMSLIFFLLQFIQRLYIFIGS